MKNSAQAEKPIFVAFHIFLKMSEDVAHMQA